MTSIVVGAVFLVIGIGCWQTDNRAWLLFLIAGGVLIAVGIVLRSNEKIRRELELIRERLEER